mmetsp:Transcript_37674/g.70450  ORF Transcript_37674/g.70450 Transcript_37674/m.70450 type:complete len:173 (-) Transcript_37674:166-684(-)
MMRAIRAIAYAIACLASVGHAFRVPTSRDRGHGHSFEDQHNSLKARPRPAVAMQVFANLLTASNQAAGWQMATHGQRLPSKRPCSKCSAAHPAVMMRVKEKPERVENRKDEKTSTAPPESSAEPIEFEKVTRKDILQYALAFLAGRFIGYESPGAVAQRERIEGLRRVLDDK